MKPFTKKELKIVFWTLSLIFMASFFNFKISLVRARDQQRKSDLGEIVKALHIYNEEFGFYPPSSDGGEIIACQKKEEVVSKNISDVDLENELKELFRKCVWGKDFLGDLSDLSYPKYLEIIPGDPDSKDGAKYYYISNIEFFQLFSHLENKKDDLFREDISSRNLPCGNRVCNYGKTTGKTPLNISLEDYKKQLMEKSL